MKYLISTVAELTGIPRNTLLAWERRYKLVQPERHENGYRSYSESDVATILRLKNAVAAGLRVGEAVELLRAEPENRLQILESETKDPTALKFDEIRQELLSALLEYRRGDAEAVLERLLHVPFRVRLREVIFPILAQVGSLWEAGAVSVAQEHYASAVLRAHLAALFITVGGGAPSAPHAVTTTFVGDNHEIAALALAIQLGISGFRVSYLGANLPADELVKFAKKFRPELVCVSCILRPNPEEFDAYLSAISQVPGVRWVLGGSVPDVPARPGVELRREWSDFQP
jgi:MerR family transcriptional regulator, light-induced transcriptional regulator